MVRFSWRKARGTPRKWFFYADGKHLATCEEISCDMWRWFGFGSMTQSQISSLEYCKTEIIVFAKRNLSQCTAEQKPGSL